MHTFDQLLIYWKDMIYSYYVRKRVILCFVAAECSSLEKTVTKKFLKIVDYLWLQMDHLLWDFHAKHSTNWTILD